MGDARPGLSNLRNADIFGASSVGYTSMPLVMTKNGPALRVAGRIIDLVARDGEAVLLVDKWDGQAEGGPLYISDAVDLVFMFRKILGNLHIEAAEDGGMQASFSVPPDVQRFIDTWGARFEDDEDDAPPEPDCRNMPRISAELTGAPVENRPSPASDPAALAA